MKFRLFALILTLSLVVWAQESPSGSAAPNSTPAPETRSCGHHAAEAKEGMACRHHSADAKDAASCCGKDKTEAKDSKSCCGEKGKDMKACMEKCEKNGGCGKDKNCCGGAASE